ncbi:MAG: polysaccharide pyruvyl transferase family protein, partial [Candidatus Sumerlaeia bacterium]|nr:polysaccharide pyruvyl transferase family protein [Candidatus Sumerlaeia bacterium]
MNHAPQNAGPRFVLTGTFHALNRGDSAMQLAAAAALRKRVAGARVAIHAPNADDDRALYEGFEVVGCSRRRPLAALKAIVRAALWRLTAGRWPLSAELASYRDADVVVDLSGDGFTPTFGWKCPVSHSIPLLLARLMNRPFCLLGQTIGPFGGLLRTWLRWVFRRAAFLTVRDAESLDHLRGWYLPCPVELTADVAFLLEPDSTRTAGQILSSLAGYDRTKPLLGVTPSNLHNVVGAGDAEGVLRALAEGCATAASRLGVQLLLVPHVFGPGTVYDDRRAAETVAAQLPASVGRLQIREPLKPQELRTLIGGCDMFVGMRMHAVISALAGCIPTLGLSYSPKLRALMHRFGLGDYVLDAARLEPDLLSEKIVGLWENRAAVQAKIAAALEGGILPAAERNMALLLSLIHI